MVWLLVFIFFVGFFAGITFTALLVESEVESEPLDDEDKDDL